jgi:putative nucleotidyltransferase with HDIG domain
MFAATPDELYRLGEIFARIVDAKSPFTAEHSVGVARLARYLGERLGLEAGHVDRLEIAALLHDLGKLRVPDEILDKPGRLDARERKIINAHSFETFRILRGIRGFEEIALWAACHHEEPDGSGYPSTSTPPRRLEARILRVADIFQAMVQSAPTGRGWTTRRWRASWASWWRRAAARPGSSMPCSPTCRAAPGLRAGAAPAA